MANFLGERQPSGLIQQRDDLAEPPGLCAYGKRAYEVVRARLAAEGLSHTGGCRAFYSPAEWAARGERYGTGGVLVCVYDSGDLRHLFDTYGEDYGPEERLNAALGAADLWFDRGTNWHSTIYLSDPK